MRGGVGVAAAAALALFAAAASAQSGGQQATPQGDAKAGQQSFMAVGCWECHGTVGQGGVGSGPRIGPTALPFAAFLQQLRTPQNQMPPYEPQILSDADAANIYAFLKSLPTPQTATNIPLLNQR